MLHHAVNVTQAYYGPLKFKQSIPTRIEIILLDLQSDHCFKRGEYVLNQYVHLGDEFYYENPLTPAYSGSHPNFIGIFYLQGCYKQDVCDV